MAGEIEADLSHRFEADSVSRALALVGEKWTLLILREAFFGVRRYGQLARALGIPRPTLSARLRTLVEAGLLDRTRYASDPDRYEYRLTKAGVDLFPSIVTLMRWGDRYLAGAEGAPIVLRHDGCGQLADPYLACRACGEEIGARDVTPERGPGYVEPATPPPAREAPPAPRRRASSARPSAAPSRSSRPGR